MANLSKTHDVEIDQGGLRSRPRAVRTQRDRECGTVWTRPMSHPCEPCGPIVQCWWIILPSIKGTGRA